MEAFIELRRQARDKRDKIIAKAKSDYAATLARIATLEQDLLGKQKVDHRSIASCVDSVIPKDRQFTTTDIMAALESLDPKRNWRKRSLDSHIYRLREKGLVKRMRKSQKTNPAIYIRTGVPALPMPYQGMTLADVKRETLAKNGKMNAAELAVTILENGYVTTMPVKRLRAAIGAEMRKAYHGMRPPNRVDSSARLAI